MQRVTPVIQHIVYVLEGPVQQKECTTRVLGFVGCSEIR